MKILLVCAAGMSTSLLVTKMEQAATAMGEEVEIFALPITDGVKKLNEVDCILLGPQVRYYKSDVLKQIKESGRDIPCEVIDMRDYGTMNGEKVYNFAKGLLTK